MARPSVLAFVSTVALVASSPGARSALPDAAGQVVEPTQELALLLGPHSAMSAPRRRSVALGQLAARRPITGERTALPVIGRVSKANGVTWLRVRLPGRPNGLIGWIDGRRTAIAVTSWHVVVDTALRRVTVYRRGRPVRAFRAVVGKPSTPTPHGEFFVEETVRLRPSDVGAPFALALSARSEVLQQFAGGPGQIALHGLANVGGVLGSAASHGCVRLDNDAVRWLAARIGPGTPVTVTR